jgi:molybdopterin molybdotransferase
MYKQYVSVTEAVEIILANVPPLEVEFVSLQQAINRVLAEPVIADCPVPSFEKSPLDGYAVRFDDVRQASIDAPIKLKVIEEIPAGHVPVKQLCAGEAARIMTGAMLPKGADTIIKFEETHLRIDSNQHFIDDNQQIEIFACPKSAGNYAKIGEDMNSGDLIVAVGRLIDAATVAVLATFGYRQVKVYKQPRVIVFASGDELVDAGEKPSIGKIRNSNEPSITAQLQLWGAKATAGGIVPDNKDMVAKELLSALEHNQVVITTGGVSVGDYDIMKEVYQEIGAEILFWRVAMRPGTPMVVAKWKDKIIFGLSGNPSASYISCELFVRAFILRLQGNSDVWRPFVKATLTTDIGKIVDQDRFLRAVSSIDKCGKLVVASLPKQKSGVLANLVDANALIYVPAKSSHINTGDMVDIILLKPPGVHIYG